jgi:hypothetical protein
MTTFDSLTGTKGRARMKEIALENKAAIETTAASLIAGLSRPATEADKLDAEALASLLIRARRARASGRSDVTLLREYGILKRNSAFRHPHAAIPATEPRAD